MSEEQSLWDHIEELRRTLIHMCVIVLLGTILAFTISPYLIKYLSSTYTLERTSEPSTLTFVYKHYKNNQSTNRTIDLKPGTLLTHEGFGSPQLSPSKALIPPGEILAVLEPIEDQLVLLGPLEGFTTAMKMSLWAGIALTSPFWGWVLYQFIGPALREQEKRGALPFLLISAIALASALFMAIYITIPLANTYFIYFNSELGMNLWTLQHYLNYSLLLIFANCIAAEAAVIGFFLVHYGLVGAETLMKHRREAIVLSFIIGALLTPPDILSQFILAVPLICIYEGLILYAKVKRQPAYLTLT